MAETDLSVTDAPLGAYPVSVHVHTSSSSATPRPQFTCFFPRVSGRVSLRDCNCVLARQLGHAFWQSEPFWFRRYRWTLTVCPAGHGAQAAEKEAAAVETVDPTSEREETLRSLAEDLMGRIAAQTGVGVAGLSLAELDEEEGKCLGRLEELRQARRRQFEKEKTEMEIRIRAELAVSGGGTLAADAEGENTGAMKLPVSQAQQTGLRLLLRPGLDGEAHAYLDALEAQQARATGLVRQLMDDRDLKKGTL